MRPYRRAARSRREREGLPAREPRIRGREGPPTVTYVVMAYLGGGWGWARPASGERPRGLCHCVGYQGYWSGVHPLPHDLVLEFERWQLWYDRHAPISHGPEHYAMVPWREFHLEGLGLALQMKRVFGEAARVFYVQPPEDPTSVDAPELECDADGGFGPVPPCRPGAQALPRRLIP